MNIEDVISPVSLQFPPSTILFKKKNLELLWFHQFIYSGLRTKGFVEGSKSREGDIVHVFVFKLLV